MSWGKLSRIAHIKRFVRPLGWVAINHIRIIIPEATHFAHENSGTMQGWERFLI
jgi:hypothetical protein